MSLRMPVRVGVAVGLAGTSLPLAFTASPPVSAETFQVDVWQTDVFSLEVFPGWGSGLQGGDSQVSCEATAEAADSGSFRLGVDPECLDGFVVASGTGYGYVNVEALVGPLTVEVDGVERIATWSQGLARSSTLTVVEDENEVGSAPREAPFPNTDFYQFDASIYPCDQVYLGVFPVDGGAYDGESLDCLLSSPDVGVSPRTTDQRVLDSDATEGMRVWVSEEPGRALPGAAEPLVTRLSWQTPGQPEQSIEYPGFENSSASMFTSVAVAPSGDHVLVGAGFDRYDVRELYRLPFVDGIAGQLERVEFPVPLFVSSGFDAADDAVVFTATLDTDAMSPAQLDEYAADVDACPFGGNCVTDRDTDVYRLDLETGGLTWLSNHRATDTSNRQTSFRDSRDPVVSANGQWVAFVSDADLDGAEQDKPASIFSDEFDPDVFAVDTTDDDKPARRITRTPDGTPVSNSPDPLQQHSPAISADGRFVAFVSNADDLDDEGGVQGDGSYMFVHDRNSDGVGPFDEPLDTSTVRAAYSNSKVTFAAAISDDGLTASFTDRAPDAETLIDDAWVRMRRDTTADRFTDREPLIVATPNAAQETSIHLFDNDRFALRTLNQWFVAQSPQGSLDDRFPAVDNPTSYTARVPYRPVVSDPVDTATGALVASAMDLSAPAGASMLKWSRSYNSLRTTPSVFGPGWSHNWTDRIDATASAPVFVDSDGRVFEFTDDGSGGFVRPTELFADLTVTVDGFELAWFSGEVWTFNLDGELTARTDWAGQSVDVARNTDGTIAQLTASTGPAITFTYTVDGLLESAVMSDGRTVTYSYTDGVLTGVVNPEGATTYTHDAENRIVTETDTTGVVVHTTEFNEAGRVIRQVLAHGEETLFTYDDSVPSTTVIDVTSGDAVTYTFDDTARLVSITDPAGNITFTEWNADGQPTGSIDRLGHNPTATYDANGNLTSITDPVRGTTTYTYDTLNRVTSVTEPTGAVTTMTYEGSERLPSTVTDALGAVTLFDVVDGLVVSVADADGVITGYGYDAQRRMDAMTNGLGNTWIYTFDAVGRQTSTTTPLGHVTSRTFDDAGRVLTSTAADGGVTTYTYDPDGRVLTVTDPTGAVTSNSYDPVTGLLATTTDPAGRVTAYTYNATAELIAVTANDGGISETDYGTLGRVTATRDPLGRESTYAYDANGNRTEVVAPDGGVTRTEYDTAGRITALEDPLGRRTVNTYDDFGRLISVTRPDGTVMSYTYDLLGRQTEVTAPDGGITTTTFTPAGRTATVTDPEGGVTSYGYDAAGQTVTVTDPNGHSTTFDYDADGRRTAVITPEGLVTTTEYDPMGRVTRLIDPAGVEHTRSYTLRGELASEQREGDGVVSYSYNPDGTMASVTDALGNTTSFTYDAAGRQATRVDATGAVEVWEYNPAGELIAQIDRLGQRTEIGYDANGRIANVADPSGRTTSHTFNPAGELIERAFGDGTTIGYSYDTMGRRVAMSDPTGVTTYNYDPNGRPIQVAAPNGTLAYSYDQAGRRTGLTYPDGTTVTYTHDPAGRLTGLTDPNTGNINYTLDDDGRLVLTELPNGQTREFTYVNGQMSRHQDHGRITDLTYDESGRIASLSGAQNHTYTYDPAGQLTQAVQDEGTYSYSYGPRGEITSITDPDRSRTFTHNANTEIDGIVDNEGRPGDVTYDAAGRMTEHVDPDGTTTTYTYDARGLLVEVTVTEPGGTEPEIPYPEPDPNQATSGSVSPIFECWTQEADGTYTAYWGYENRTTQNGQPVGRIIAHGNQNQLTPATFQGTQPDRFGVPGVVAGRPGRTAFGATAPNAFVTTGWDGSNLVWKLGNRTATASNTPSKQCTSVPTAPTSSVTTEARTHDGDGALTHVTINQTGVPSSSSTLLWDMTTAIPNITVIDATTGSSNSVYGATRESSTGIANSFTALGDQVAPIASVQLVSPFGPTTELAVGFGYRGELETTPGVHLRARTLLTGLGLMGSADPLDGVAGTSTYTNRFHYADNDPIGRIDPLGTRTVDAALAAQEAFVGSISNDPWFAYYEDTIRRAGADLTLNDLAFEPRAYLDNIVANGAAWLRPGTGTCVGAQGIAGPVGAQGDLCVVALTNDFAIVGAVAAGLAAGVPLGASLGGGVLVTNAQEADDLRGDAVCGQVATTLGLGGAATACAGVTKLGAPTGIFTITSSVEGGGVISSAVYMSRTRIIWEDNGFLYKLIEASVGRLSLGRAEASYCRNGVFDEEEARSMGVWAQSVC